MTKEGEEDQLYYDMLPPSLRELVSQCPIGISAKNVYLHYKRKGLAEVELELNLRIEQYLDKAELQKQSGEWSKK